jgi:bifunctional non-homologous end joining protein LigD
VLREPGRPNVAYMVTPDKERRYVGGGFIQLNDKMRERLRARVNATQWLKPGLVGRVRHLKGEKQLRHATLRAIREDS